MLLQTRQPQVLFGLALSLMLMAAPTPAETGKLGKIDFPNSGAAEAQDAFIRGVLLLHNFEYEDSREAFRQAQAVDTGFAMAYWGEAMTHNHPLWRRQDRDAALDALERFGDTRQARHDRTKTERERGYMEAVEILYGDGEKVDRDHAYSEAMGTLAERYPDDMEARAFWALSILGTGQGEREFDIYMRAGAVAEEVFAANRLHPGAVHYMIHSYDDPIHAPLGLRAARVYAKIAPAASHAQHMISHIYVALGDWADSVQANVNSFEVSEQRRDAKGLSIDASNYHSLHWLEYSYLQLGRFDDAREKLDMMTEFARESRSPRALWYHAAMRASYIVETDATDAPEEIDPILTQVTGAAADAFASGYAAILAGDRDKALKYVDRMSERYTTAASGQLCGTAGGYTETSQRDLDVAAVMQTNLRAMIAMHDGKTDKAIRLFDEATAAEEALSHDFGPPIIVKPSHELYGEALLKLGRPEEARVQFEKALERAPRRSLSLAGLAQAAKATGDVETAMKCCAEIATNYANADVSVAERPICN